MGRSDTINRLRTTRNSLRANGIIELYLFGSVARDQAGPSSDIDLFVDPDYEHFGFVELLRVEAMLSRELGCPVDLTTRDGLHPLLCPEIEREAIRVP